MTIPDVVQFPDGHFRHAIYGLGPYIADYPEQASLACIVQGWCPKCVFIVCLTVIIILYSFICRCTARPDNLDGPSMLRRREHTDTLVEMFELGALWDDYGIVGDIVVSHFLVPKTGTAGVHHPATCVALLVMGALLPMLSPSGKEGHIAYRTIFWSPSDISAMSTLSTPVAAAVVAVATGTAA